jgi:parallel beta-helix repeat protein
MIHIQNDQIVGRHFRIVGKLGTGGMGQVYKAIDENLGREVAIKFLLEEPSSNPDVTARFVNEGRVLATINHPSVITVFASDIDPDLKVPFLVMEFVDGDTISSYAERFAQEPTALLRYFIQLLEGIHACHLKGIIHRDIKPANILINRDGHLRLVDFGIAKSAKKQTKTGIAMGTPHYMSPEQCLGKSEITGKADVYSIGIMLWEFLSGALPFDITTEVDDPALSIALMHLNEPPPADKLRSQPSAAPFIDLLTAMLAKKPDQRPEIPAIIETLKTQLLALEAPLRAPTGQMPMVTPPPEAGRFEVGAIINEIYRIETLLGEGGMGRVFKALDLTLNRVVALKTLHEDAVKDESLVERFIREGRLLATVGHPNVMNIHAAARDRASGQPFLITEFIDGESLSKLKPALMKDRRKVVPLMLQVAEGVAACHAKGIIHRDLKPANILVTREGLLKVLDFGIAKTSARLTKTGVTVGTPEYMSPEQCLGTSDLTSKSDIYSMGVIFWELVFGDVPFRADDASNPELSVAMKHLSATLPVQRAIPDAELAEIIPVIRRMLDKDPGARPDLEELVDILERFVDSHLTGEAGDRTTTSRRRAQSLRTSAIKEMFSEPPTVTGAPAGWWRKWVGITLAVGVVALGVGWWSQVPSGRRPGATPFEQLRDEFQRAMAEQNLPRAKVAFDRMARRSDPMALEETNRVRPIYSAALYEEGLAAASAGKTVKAISILADAVATDPGHASAAATLAHLQETLRRNLQQQIEHDLLRSRSSFLLEQAGIGTWTVQALTHLDDVQAKGLASEARAFRQGFIEALLAKGTAAATDDPATALALFETVQTHFPETPGIVAKVAVAKAALASSAELLTLKTAIAEKMRAFDERLLALPASATAQPYLALLEEIQALGPAAHPPANAARGRLFQALRGRGDDLKDRDQKQALHWYRQALLVDPTAADVQALVTTLTESRLTHLAADERRKRVSDLLGKLEPAIKGLKPDTNLSPVLADLDQLEAIPEGQAAAMPLRAELGQHFTAEIRRILVDQPEEALKSLPEAQKIGLAPTLIEELRTAAMQRLQELAARAEEEKRQQDRAGTIARLKAAMPPGKAATMPLADLDRQIAALLRDHPQDPLAQALAGEFRTYLAHRFRALKSTAPEDATGLLPFLIDGATSPADRTTWEKERDALTKVIADQAGEIAKREELAKLKKQAQPLVGKTEPETLKKLADLLVKLDALDSTMAVELRKESRSALEAAAAKVDSRQTAGDLLQRLTLLPALSGPGAKDWPGDLEKTLDSLARKRLAYLENLLKTWTVKQSPKRLQEIMDVYRGWSDSAPTAALLKDAKQTALKEADRLARRSPAKARELLAGMLELPLLADDNDLTARLEKLGGDTAAEDQPPPADTPKPPTDPGDGPSLESQFLALMTEDQVETAWPTILKLIGQIENEIGPELGIRARRQAAELLAKRAQSHHRQNRPEQAKAAVERALAADPNCPAAKSLQAVLAAPPATTVVPPPADPTPKPPPVDDKKEVMVGSAGAFKTVGEALRQATAGMTVVVQPGTYRESITIPSGVTVAGRGQKSSIVIEHPATAVFLSGSAVLRNMTVVSKDGGMADTIIVTGGDPIIEECIITNSNPSAKPDWSGAIAVRAGRPNIRNNTITGRNGMGILVRGGTPAIRGNTVQNCGIYGILYTDGGGGRLENNTIIANTMSGVGLKAGANPVITGNTITRNGENGIMVYQAGRGQIQNNTISGNKMSGVLVTMGGKPQEIVGNQIKENNSHGVHVEGSDSLARLGANTLVGNRGKPELAERGGRIDKL